MANWLQKKDIMDRSTIDAIAGQVSQRHDDLEKSINDIIENINNLKGEIRKSEESLDLYLNDLESKLNDVDSEFAKKDQSLSEVIDSMNSKHENDMNFINKSIGDIKKKNLNDVKDLVQMQNIIIDDIVSCKNHILSSEELIKDNQNELRMVKEQLETNKNYLLDNLDILENNLATSQLFIKKQLENINNRHDKFKKQSIITLILLILAIIATNI